MYKTEQKRNKNKRLEKTKHLKHGSEGLLVKMFLYGDNRPK